MAGSHPNEISSSTGDAVQVDNESATPVIGRPVRGRRINIQPISTFLRALVGGGVPTVGFVLIILMGATAIASDRFLTPLNLFNILDRASIFIVIGVGATIVITARGIDLSVGSVVGLATASLGTALIVLQLPTPVGILLALGLATICGIAIGLATVLLRVPPIIVTLAALVTYRGLVLVHLEGRIYHGFPEPILWLARGTLLGISTPVALALTVAFSGALFLHHTTVGRHITAMGDNPEAARRAGLNVNRYTIVVYGLAGFLSGFGGIMLAGRLNGIQATTGTGMEIAVLAAVFIGGTSLFGGRGAILGTALGVLIVQVIENGLLLAGVAAFWQQVALGFILVAAVATRTLREQSLTGWLST